MSQTSDSSLARMLSVLDLFTDQRLQWSAEEVGVALGMSLPTVYRYLKTLGDAGLLQRGADARFTLGPRVVMLDYLIRQADPVLQCATRWMKELVEQTGFDCVMSSLFGDQLLDTHREYGSAPANLSYGRGRPRPLFLGAAPKVIVAAMSTPQLHRLFDRHLAQIAQAQLPTDWSTFRRYYHAIRKDGYYFSNGELEPELAAIAVAVPQPDGSARGALSLVTTVTRMAMIDRSKLVPLIQRTAQQIANHLN